MVSSTTVLGLTTIVGSDGVDLVTHMSTGIAQRVEDLLTGAAYPAGDLILDFNSGSNRTLTVKNAGAGVAQILLEDGSAALPPFGFATSPTTGLFSPSNGVLGLATGAAERARLDGSGNLGLGTTTPNYFALAGTTGALTVQGTSGGTTSTGRAVLELASGAADNANNVAGDLNFIAPTNSGAADKRIAAIEVTYVGSTANNRGGLITLYAKPDGGAIAQALSIGSTGVLTCSNKIYPATDASATQSAAGLYAGTGVPNNANGSNGDFYFRSDGGAGTSIYMRRAGAWVGIV